jgi:hypothetical protein
MLGTTVVYASGKPVLLRAGRLLRLRDDLQDIQEDLHRGSVATSSARDRAVVIVDDAAKIPTEN